MAVHLSDVKEPLLVDTDVSEEVDVVLRGYEFVVPLDYILVVLSNATEDSTTDQFSVIVGELQDVVVTEVMVGCYPDICYVTPL